MSDEIFPTKNHRKFFLPLLIFPVLFAVGCAGDSAKTDGANQAAKNSSAKNTIAIEKDSPADTVRVFYKDLREGKFREALFLTNMRPAIEGLTDAELKDLQVDFANLAKQIPAEVEINGEIITGKDATVTAKLPDNETDKMELQQIRLRQSENENVWTILTLDDQAEKTVKEQGKDYLFNLRVETHEREAKKMFDRIAKAEIVFAAQNAGQYGNLPALVANNFLPEDALSAESTGYNYKIAVGSDKKSYAVSAEPAIYGKSGKNSFAYAVRGNHASALRSEDRKGQPVKN